MNKTRKITSKREAWIDNVKMLAMLFVILGHTWRIIHCPLPDWLNLFILSFNMALFVLMSGYSSVKAFSKIDTWSTLYSYIFKITQRVMLPSVFFSAVVGILLQIEHYFLIGGVSLIKLLAKLTIIVVFCVAFKLRNKSNWKIFFTVCCLLSVPIAFRSSIFWFFNMIWTVCVSTALAFYISAQFKSSITFIYILAFLFALMFDSVCDKTSDFIHFFIIGYIISRYEILKHINHATICLSCFTVATLLLSIVGEHSMNFWEVHIFEFLKSEEIHLYIGRIVISSLYGISFMITTKLLSKEYSLFSLWGAQTLAIYMVHASIIEICYAMPFNFKIEGNLYLAYAIPTTVLLTYVSILIIKIMKRWEMSRAFCLGDIK